MNTGDQLTYSPGNGSGIDVLNIVGAASTLQDNQTLFAARISNDVIGVATVKVGLGTTGSFVGIASTKETLALFSSLDLEQESTIISKLISLLSLVS